MAKSQSKRPGRSLQDLAGRRFGKLIVVIRATSVGRTTRWTCQCECGRIKIMRADGLRSSIGLSCWNCRPKAFKDLTGKTFGMLTVIELAERSNSGEIRWKCRCQCGNFTIVQRGNLQSNIHKCCKQCRPRQTREHHLLRQTWNSMIRRCGNPKDASYYRYGGRGISVCQRWIDSFDNFKEDIGPRPSERHSIDRIDNDGPYEKSNCRWATPKQQSRNGRHNRILTIDGVSRIITEWAEQSVVSYETIRRRLKSGWDPKLAIEAPAYAVWDLFYRRSSNPSGSSPPLESLQ